QLALLDLGDVAVGEQQPRGAQPLAAAGGGADRAPQPAVRLAVAVRPGDPAREGVLEAGGEGVGRGGGGAGRLGGGAHRATCAGVASASSGSGWACSASQGLNAHGVLASAVASASTSTHRWAITSSRSGSGSSAVVATQTGQTSFSTTPESSTAR